MNPSGANGTQATQALLEAPAKNDAVAGPAGNGPAPEVNEKDQRKPPRKENRQLAIWGILAAVVAVIFVRVLLHRPAPSPKPLTASSNGAKAGRPAESNMDNVASRTPIIDATRPAEKPLEGNPVNADQVAHTAMKAPVQGKPGTLGGVAPFGTSDQWSPPPYSANGAQGDTNQASSSAAPTEATYAKGEHDALEKASLVFVRNNSTGAGSRAQETAPAVDLGIGLPAGTRLRAKLESAVNTAVQTPVVAVIEYNYERNGEIVVPAGSKVFGRLEAADRSGYIGIRFDSLTMPDGASLPVEAAATDLQLRPLRGRVEGKNTGKNIVVRSLAGVGEIGAVLVGRGSLNQPLSESDLLRERVGNNIGLASDQQLASLALTQRIVVSVPAGREIYVVLEKRAKELPPSKQPSEASSQTNIEELRRLLQLQREMSQTDAKQPQ